MHYKKKEKKQRRKHSSQINFNISLLLLDIKEIQIKGFVNMIFNAL